jgi:hypothetical protein
LNGIQDEYYPTLDHVPLIERKLVDILWDKFVFRDSHSAEHGLLPETSTSFDGSKRIYGDQNENSLHRPRNHAEREGLGMVLVPGLYIEGKER